MNEIRKKVTVCCQNIIGRPLCLWKKRKPVSRLTAIPVLDVELVGRCNLNCKCCTHFSPLAEKDEVLPQQLEQDFMLLNNVLGDRLRRINLLGGEPLLHSDICACMEIARRIFPAQKIVIVTNGILLPGKGEDFWRTARERRVEMEVTKYPLSLDYRRMKETADRSGVRFRFYGRSGFVQKTQYYLPLDCEGGQDGEKSYRNCFMAGNCFTLRAGKVFPCSYAAFIGRFNAAFGKNIPQSADDYADLRRETKEQILQKLAGPIPMCRYCDVENRTYGNRWGVSKRSADEWS